MAQQVTADAGILAALKIRYTARRFGSLLWRNSPLLRMIPRVRIGGKQYNFSAGYTGGSCVSSDFSVLGSNLTNGIGTKNVEFGVTPGSIFGAFTLTQLEKLSSRTERDAYIKLADDKMFFTFEAVRKYFAAVLYGRGYGELGQVSGGASIGAPVALNDTAMIVPSDTAVKMMIGTMFDVTETPSVTGTLDTGTAGGHYRVTGQDAVAGDSAHVKITFTPGVVYAGGWAQNTYICLAGGRDGSGNPNAPTGLGGWLPTDRNTSAGHPLGDSFYGVTRSVSTSQLGGQYYKRDSSGGELYSQAVSQLVKMVRRGGGVPQCIVLNDNDYMNIQVELQSYRNFWQSVGIEPNKLPKRKEEGGPTYIYGVEALKYAFSSTYIERVIDDPHCPAGTFYVLDLEGDSDKAASGEGGAIEFAGLSNPDAIVEDRIVDNNPGRAPVEGVTDATENPYQLMIDDYLSVQPAARVSTGPAAEVDMSLYGNFALHSPGSNGVGQF